MSISLKSAFAKLRVLTAKREPALLIAFTVILVYLCVCVTGIFIATEKITGTYLKVFTENAENQVRFFSYNIPSYYAENDRQQNAFLSDVPNQNDFLTGSLDVPDSCNAVYIYYLTENTSFIGYRLWPDSVALLSSAPSFIALDKLRNANGKKKQFLQLFEEKSSLHLIDKTSLLLFTFTPLRTQNNSISAIIGAEFSLAGVISYRKFVLALLLCFFLIPSIAAVILFFTLYIKYVKPLQTSSITDSLTGLYNRKYFKIQYEKLVNSSRRYQSELAVIMLDIDFFKQYNDTYGHQTGDECLKKITNAIKLQANRPLDLVFRYGGEEFVILLPDTNLDGAVNVAKKIKNAVVDLNIEHRESAAAPCVTVSQGIFMLPKNVSASENMYEYIEKADRALYRSKHDGRNRYTVFIATPDVSSSAPGMSKHVFQSAAY